MEESKSKSLTSHGNIVRIKHGGVHYEGGPIMMQKRHDALGVATQASEHNKRPYQDASERVKDLIPLDGPIKQRSLEMELNKLHAKKNSIDMKLLRQQQKQDRGRPINKRIQRN